MWNFIRRYALEIYTVLSIALLVCAAMIGELSVIRKLVVIATFLFILHEWEETRYPGGFISIIGTLFLVKVNDNLERTLHIPACIALLILSIVPFVFDKTPMITMTLATFGIIEGLTHTAGIRVFRTQKFYTPGMITAWLETGVSILLIIYLVTNHLGQWYDYLLGPAIMLVGFGIFQKTMTLLLGIRYRDMPKYLKRQWKLSVTPTATATH